ncbi:hypothetical protein [Reyranella soli]|uniref:Uncharacterized protein n=1 Tax=Reyranella soli TaxID=1230389 RepID=A0A512NCK8_9HYPH|nr:hypothetical protein [Reyranella soli]GEP56683.1 hypothetical protein RSO01_38490 [Reyranella soli]
MFNVRPEAMIPWLHVEPPPADELPGFRMNPDGSVRGAQRGGTAGSFGFGMPLGTLTSPYAGAAQALAQPILRIPTPDLELLAQSTLPTGLAGLRAAPWDNVFGFNLSPEKALLGLNLVGSGSDAQRRETNWFEETRPESALPSSSDTAPTPTPPGAEDSTSLIPPQLPEWLYKVVTMPVPQLSTAFDPRTGRRIVPNEPLIGLARSYLTTNQNARGSEDTRPYVDDISPLPDLESPNTPSAERWPPSDTPVWQTDINSGPGVTTARPANSEPTPEAVMWNTWPQPLINGWPYAEADSAKREVSWPTVAMPQPIGVAPTPSVGPVADSNFILANAGDPELPQAEQRMPPPQDQPTEPKNPVTPTEPAGRLPERRTEALSRSIEDYRRATADQIDGLVSAIATYGSRIYEDSILKARDDLARLAERLRNDTTETTLSILNSFLCSMVHIGTTPYGALA